MEPKSYYAFFDLDETVIQCKSMIKFLNVFYGKKKFGSFKKKIYFYKIKLLTVLNFPRENLNKIYYKQFKNIDRAELDYLGKLWFRYERRYNKNLFNKQIVDEINNHRLKNAQIVLVSGSFRSCLMPIAQHLNIDNMLSVVLVEKNGKLTGELIPPQTIGKGKSEAIQQLIQKNGASKLEDCYAYGDHISDFHMLNLVGHPVIVKNDKKLLELGMQRGWRIID